jgi:hypothetical protein
MAADWMLSTWNNGEAELFIVFSGLIQIFDDDNDMIDPLNHARQLSLHHLYFVFDLPSEA